MPGRNTADTSMLGHRPYTVPAWTQPLPYSFALSEPHFFPSGTHHANSITPTVSFIRLAHIYGVNVHVCGANVHIYGANVHMHGAKFWIQGFCATRHTSARHVLELAFNHCCVCLPGFMREEVCTCSETESSHDPCYSSWNPGLPHIA